MGCGVSKDLTAQAQFYKEVPKLMREREGSGKGFVMEETIAHLARGPVFLQWWAQKQGCRGAGRLDLGS